MVKLRGDPSGVTQPALRKQIVLKTNRGQLIAQKWPRARGKPTNPITIEQNAWLKWSARVFSYVDAGQMAEAITSTKGTGLYPRDLITMAMRGKLYEVVLEDGTEIKTLDETLERKMFNGAILHLDANAAMQAGVQFKPQWPLPITDTFSFWNAANPQRLTIPTGVQVVEFTIGGVIASATATRFGGSVVSDTGRVVINGTVSAPGTQAQTGHSGPVNVMGGEYFEAQFFADQNRTLLAGESTFFKVNVLQAVCPPPT